MVLWPNWLANFTRGLFLHATAQVGLAIQPGTTSPLASSLGSGRTGTFKGHADAGIVCKSLGWASSLAGGKCLVPSQGETGFPLFLCPPGYLLLMELTTAKSMLDMHAPCSPRTRATPRTCTRVANCRLSPHAPPPYAGHGQQRCFCPCRCGGTPSMAAVFRRVMATR